MMPAALADALAGDPRPLRAHPYDPDAPFWRAADEQHVDLLLLDLAHTGRVDELWPETARQRGRSATVDAVAMRGLRDRELGRVLDLLADAGVSCLVIKGAALGYTLYRQPHTRRRSDADLLVRAGDAERVARVLEAGGYARATEISGDFATSQMHFDRADCADHRFALDIHWRVVNTHAFVDAIAFDEYAASRVPVPGLGASAWTLSTAHALALACVHRAAHHWNSDDLLWLWDVHLLASALPAAEAGAFADAASRAGIRAVCADALQAAADRFATPSAAGLIARVAPRRGDREEASARFLTSGLRQADILRSDLASLGWRRGVSLLREHLFPPVDYMRRQYDRWPDLLLPAAYLHRIVRARRSGCAVRERLTASPFFLSV